MLAEWLWRVRDFVVVSGGVVRGEMGGDRGCGCGEEEGCGCIWCCGLCTCICSWEKRK